MRTVSQHVLTTASLECKGILGAKFYFKQIIYTGAETFQDTSYYPHPDMAPDAAINSAQMRSNLSLLQSDIF